MSFQTWWALKAEAGHRFELLGEIEQLVLLCVLSHQLDPHRQSVMHSRRKGDRRHAGEADWKHELYIARPFVAEERRHFVDGHWTETKGRCEQKVEVRLQRHGDGAIGRGGRGLERVEVVHGGERSALLGELPD